MRRRYLYARCHDIFKKCPRRLIDSIEVGSLDEIMDSQELPSSDRIRDVFEALWCESRIGANMRQPMDDSRIVYDREALFTPIVEAEVFAKIRRIESTSAAGPDGISKMHLKKEGTVLALTSFFNMLLLCEHYPSAWRRNRTTLIPKAGRDRADVGNWRPITVGSMVGRIFSSILDTRLRRIISISDRQRGFVLENGCRGNTAILEEALRSAKSGNGGVFSILDIKRAFDTLPHEVIRDSLISKGISPRVTGYLVSMFRDCSTEIKAANGELVRVQIRRGVKQGDPLSPLLFNICIDRILERLQEQRYGIKIGERIVSTLAFADDIVLLAQDPGKAREQIDLVREGLEDMGMSLSVNKCSAFRIVAYRKTWYVSDPQIVVSGAPIQYLHPESITKYLGVVMGPWRGVLKGTEITVIRRFLTGLSRLPLKPAQKIHLLNVHILPKFVYSLSMTAPGKVMLGLLDKEIRGYVKQCLHLVSSTTTPFFYASKRDGGLGLLRLEHTIPLAVLRNGIKMIASTDVVASTVGSNDRWESVLQLAARSLDMNWPASLEDVEATKVRLKARNLEVWSCQRTQGQGSRSFRNDGIGNRWLLKPSLLRASRFTDAIRLRTNTYGTRAALSRYSPNIDVSCRRCGINRETLGHVLGSCIATKSARIHRHNEIRDLLADRCGRRGNRVMVEPSWNVGGVLYKPDLIVIDKSRALVVDVTVRYENQSYLAAAFREKLDKYRPLLPDIGLVFRRNQLQVIPIVVGSRGALPAPTRKRLEMLGLSRADCLTISLIALRSSIEIANRFIDD